MSNINQRKIEHISIACNDLASNRNKGYFDEIKLNYRALPEINFDEIDTSIEFLGKELSFPLVISSMTGGNEKLISNINHNLAMAAENTSIAMSVGSQRIMFNNKSAEESFKLRELAPSTILISNIGAVQLNYGFSIEECKKAVEILDADALYLHLNPLQEILQPEGDVNFSNLANKIGKINKQLDKPILIKEVGAGISKKDAELLYKNGIKYIDVAGTGGTSWSYIEGIRNNSDNKYLGDLFADFGIPTPVAVQDIYNSKFGKNLEIISSGGLRNGIDMVKSMILGAKICGMANIFLKAAMESSFAVEQQILKIKKEFQICMFLLGIKKAKDLIGNNSLVRKNIINYP